MVSSFIGMLIALSPPTYDDGNFACIGLYQVSLYRLAIRLEREVAENHSLVVSVVLWFHDSQLNLRDHTEPFEDEIHPRLRFAHRGLVAMANSGTKDSNDSQFFITLGTY